jgi:CheY-like chemotaxis protein/two-component sensor histidine kinase
MYRNALRLKKLITQVLDVRKIEAGKIKIKVLQSDIAEYIKSIYMLFNDWAENKSITYKFISDIDSKIIWFDPDITEKVLVNLLSNAFKYTPNNGRIHLSITQKNITSDNKKSDFLEISVKDSGIGISQDKIDKIFDRFYQVDHKSSGNIGGTGIGLSITKDLLEYIHASIQVKSEEGFGSEFIIKFPCNINELEEVEYIDDHNIGLNQVKEKIRLDDIHSKKETETVITESDTDESTERPKLLLIEDNDDILTYMQKEFSSDFAVFTAPDGETGIELAKQEIPDLVISDIMMPGISGLIVCQTLKKELSTSHIPIILLTALTGEVNMLEGMQLGADDYIEKPFSIDILRLKIKNIIDSRNRLKVTFNKKLTIKPKDITVTSADEIFFQKLLEIVEEKMVDPEFNGECLSREVGMSLSLLYKKIRSLTNCTVNEFIRVMRLKRAAQLISLDQGNVNEVAYLVGFNNRSYFSKCFKKQFGHSPKEYKEKSTNIHEDEK